MATHVPRLSLVVWDSRLAHGFPPNTMCDTSAIWLLVAMLPLSVRVNKCPCTTHAAQVSFLFLSLLPLHFVRESCSQFDLLPLIYLTLHMLRRWRLTSPGTARAQPRRRPRRHQRRRRQCSRQRSVRWRGDCRLLRRVRLCDHQVRECFKTTVTCTLRANPSHNLTCPPSYYLNLVAHQKSTHVRLCDHPRAYAEPPSRAHTHIAHPIH